MVRMSTDERSLDPEQIRKMIDQNVMDRLQKFAKTGVADQDGEMDELSLRELRENNRIIINNKLEEYEFIPQRNRPKVRRSLARGIQAALDESAALHLETQQIQQQFAERTMPEEDAEAIRKAARANVRRRMEEEIRARLAARGIVQTTTGTGAAGEQDMAKAENPEKDLGTKPEPEAAPRQGPEKEPGGASPEPTPTQEPATTNKAG